MYGRLNVVGTQAALIFSSLLAIGVAIASPAMADAESYAEVQQFSADGSPHFPAANRKTNRLYVSDVRAGTVTMFNAKTGEKLAETATGAGAHTVIVDVKKNLVYVTNRGANTLSILDGATNAKLADIPVGSLPHGLDLPSDCGCAFVSNTGSNDVTLVDTKTRGVRKTIPAGMGPWGVAVDSPRRQLFTANTYEGSVSRIDIRSGATLAKIITGGRPWNIKVASTGRTYATDEAGGVLHVMENDAVIATVPVGPGPHGVVLDEEEGIAFVAVTGANAVAIVDLATNTVSQHVTVGSGPTAISIGKGGRVYVANQAGGTISILRERD